MCSHEYTQYTILSIKKKITLNYPKPATMGFCQWDFASGLKIEFETAVVNEPSVFEPLKVYCKSLIHTSRHVISYNAQILFKNIYM